MGADKVAMQYFQQGFNCAQSVLVSCGEGLDVITALKVSCAFGGGMSRMGETCGVVTGAMMAIGLKFGMTDADKPEAKAKTYQVVNDFVKEFKTRHKHITCTELIGCNLSTPEGVLLAKEKKVHENICRTLIHDAVDILDGLLK